MGKSWGLMHSQQPNGVPCLARPTRPVHMLLVQAGESCAVHNAWVERQPFVFNINTRTTYMTGTGTVLGLELHGQYLCTQGTAA